MERPIVKTVETEVQTFAAAMGISPEREKVVDDLLEKAYENTVTYPLALEYVSEGLENANELAYVAFHLGAHAEGTRQN